MSTPESTASTSTGHDGNSRKRVSKARVCKACDRCRLKKSKCSGVSACSRCRAENAICVFGERRKTHDRIYPKGYVEMLEQQQAQLVAGLRDLYRRLTAGEDWPGTALPDAANGYPLTHDILERLDLLSTQTADFEGGTERMQRRLAESVAAPFDRRDSMASEPDHGHEHSHQPAFPHSTPTSAGHSPVGASFRAPPTPPMHVSSPFPRPSQLIGTSNTTFSAMVQPGSVALTSGHARHDWRAADPVVNDNDLLDFMTYEPPVGFGPTMSPAYGGAQFALSKGMAMQHGWNDPVDMDFGTFIAAN